jgi:hypothetical protein
MHPGRSPIGLKTDATRVAQATDWKWSSACWYTWRQSVGVPIAWIE